MVKRIAVLDGSENNLFVEDIPNSILESEPYNGSIEAYVRDNYDLEDGNYSIMPISSAQYIGESGEVYDLDEKIDELEEEARY